MPNLRAQNRGSVLILVLLLILLPFAVLAALSPTRILPGAKSPLPQKCKTGVNSFSVEKECKNGFRYVSYECYDGFANREGGPKVCRSSKEWQKIARAACEGRSNCPKPTPTISPSPTPTTTPKPECAQPFKHLTPEEGAVFPATTQSITFTWSTSENATRYDFTIRKENKIDKVFSSRLSVVNQISVPLGQNTNLLPGFSYYWYIDSLNDAAACGWGAGPRLFSISF